MGDEKWQRVREVFDAALRQKPEARRDYVKAACGDDKSLLAEVESLFSSLDSSQSFMEKPAVAHVADVIKSETKTLQPGTRFGHYEIVREIGVGGMGRVYVAKDEKLDRRVAIKILNEEFSRHGSNLQRFIQEAKAASALNHPNILVIHEIGEADEAHFIVSEFIEGHTLREILIERSPQLVEVLDISIQVANALTAAHAIHLVHRDIKPDNMMIRPDGYVKVLDFGLAKLVENKQQAFLDFEESTVRQNQTAKGVILGTVNYMSPEQAKGEPIDERTDIFSLGAVIYEMVVGRTPFAGDSIPETLANLMRTQPQPLSCFGATVPNELNRIVSKMLRKNRDERYQTMKDVLSDLKELRADLTSEEKLARPHSPDGDKVTALLQATTRDTDKQPAETHYSFSQKIAHHKSPAAFALIALLIGAIGLGYYFLSRHERALNFQAGKMTRLTSSGRVKTAVVSQDGKFIIYAQEENNGWQSLWMQHIGSESNVQIVQAADIEYRGLDISPDNNNLYYIDSKGSLYRMAVLGSTPKKLLDELRASHANHHLGFSPDGQHISFVRSLEKGATALFIANADGTSERKLTSFEPPITLGQWSSWSPDGKVIACGFLSEGYQNILAIQVADGTSAPILPQGWNGIGTVSWMSDSKSLLAIGSNPDLNQIWKISYPGGEARRITNDTNVYSDISLNSDGRSLAAVRTEQVAHVWTTTHDDATRAVPITAGFEKYDGKGFLGWLPSGKIVYDSKPSGKPSVWVMEPDGSNPEHLLRDVGSSAISPDGRYIVYPKGSADDYGLWRMDFKDRSEQRLTKGVNTWPAFSPDSKWVVYTGYHERVALWRVPVEGGEQVQILNEFATCPTVSPNGKNDCFYFANRGAKDCAHLVQRQRNNKDVRCQTRKLWHNIRQAKFTMDTGWTSHQLYCSQQWRIEYLATAD